MSRNPTPFNRLRLFKVYNWVPNGDSENLSEFDQGIIEETTSLDSADLVSSQFSKASFVGSDRHMLVIDLDVPAALVPSSTPGHSHLFIESRMSWAQYERVLEALADAGILERGYVDAAKKRGFSAVRLPWVRK